MDAITDMPYQSLYSLFVVAITDVSYGVSIWLIPHHNTIDMFSYSNDMVQAVILTSIVIYINLKVNNYYSFFQLVLA